MSKQIDQLIKQAIKEHKIDRPILATRVVGNKLELFLLFGDVITVPIEFRETRNDAVQTVGADVEAKPVPDRGQIAPQ